MTAVAGGRLRMALLDWNDSFSVGVKAIDDQHKGLFGIVDGLHTAMMQRQAKTVTGPLLNKLVKYTQVHFSAEEKMMQATNYPGLIHHRAVHLDLFKQVKEFLGRYERGGASLNIELLRFLSDWLTGHIQHEDKEYGPWLNQHGIQ
jgi:hemerythrin